MLLVALAAVGVGLLTQRSDAGSPSRYGASAARLNSTEVGGYVLQAQAASDRVWVLTCVSLCGAADTGLDTEQLVEVDQSSRAVIRRLPLIDASAFTIADRSLWVAHFLSGDLTRINPLTGRVTAQVSLRLPAPIAPGVRQFLPISLSASGGYLWVSTSRGWIAQIELHTATLLRMVRTPSEDNTTTTDRFGTWVAEDLDGFGILRPHRLRLRIRTIMQAGLPLDVFDVINGGSVIWALAGPDDIGSATTTMVLEISPRTGRLIRRVRLSDARGAVAVGSALYVGDIAHGRIYRINRDGTTARLDTPRHDAVLATASASALWATTNTKPGRLLRIRLPRG